MYCSNCGKQIDDDTKFCPFCGSGQGQPEPVQPKQPVQTQRNGGDISSAVKSNPTFKVLFLMVSVFFVALIAFLGFVLFRLKANDTPEQEDIEASTKEVEEEMEEELEEVMPFSNGIQVGDIVTFGSYEQDGRLSNGPEPIEWDVLDEQDGRYLLISHYVLDRQQFDDGTADESLRANEDSSATVVTWETCYLRKWLNNEFYNTAFSDIEQQYIVKVTNTTRDFDDICKNDIHNIKPEWWDEVFFERSSRDKSGIPGIGGNPTQDNVFVLSFDEFVEYYEPRCYNFVTHYQALKSFVSPTQYAVDLGLGYAVFKERFHYDDDTYGEYNARMEENVHQDYRDDGRICGWILRSPGSSGYYVMSILANEKCFSWWGEKTEFFGIRPAIWVSY